MYFVIMYPGMTVSWKHLALARDKRIEYGNDISGFHCQSLMKTNIP